MSSSTSQRGHRRRRLVITVVICLGLAGGAAAAIAARKPKAATVAAAASIFKTATVSRGDLSTTASVDGSVQLSSTLTVLHRIEGQTSSSSGSTPTASPSKGSAPASTLPGAATAALVVDCSGNTLPAPPAAPPTTTTVPADSTTTTTSTPDTTPPSIPPTTTSATTPTGIVPPTTATVPCDTTTTTPAGPTAGAPTGGAPTGGARTGGPTTGAARSATSGTGAAASTARVTQTVTSIIGANVTVHQGDVLYTVDGAPVVALDGALPAWRTLSTSATDGADIAQLEDGLVALGYDPGQKVTIDDHFDSATRTMVKAWQEGLGVTVTGTVSLGSVVFLPSAATVSTVAQKVGDTIGDGDTMLTLATPVQEVVIDVPAGDEAKVVPGLAVKIGSVAGAVTRLRSANRNGTVVVEAVITPAAPIDKATNGSAVKVTLTIQNDASVLIAPAEALVSRLDGTYAVQVQTPDGTTKWLTVDLLGVSGGNVAISGTDVTEGTIVLLPL